MVISGKKGRVIVRFWGTRGSIAKAGRSTLKYGGNTSCVELRTESGTLAVLDCGTGVHGLGQALSKGGEPLRGHILLSHTHWDHIQGLPFFLPLFVPGNEWDIYAPRGLSQAVETTLAGQRCSTPTSPSRSISLAQRFATTSSWKACSTSAISASQLNT